MTTIQTIASSATTLMIAITGVHGSSLSESKYLIREHHNPKVSFKNADGAPVQSLIKEDIFHPTMSTDIIKQAALKPNAFDKVEGELANYLKLKPNWDYSEGVVPSETAIKTSIAFLEKIKDYNIDLPKPMLVGDGEVCLYWKKSGMYIEVGFEESGLFSYLVDNRKEPFSEDDCVLNTFAQTKLYKALLEISINS